MKKKKLVLTSVFILGICVTISTAFSAFIIENEIKPFSLNIDPSEIKVDERTQNFINYVGVSKSLTRYGYDIVDDEFSITLSFNQVNYNSARVNSYGGLKTVINFSNFELFNFLANDVKNEFVIIESIYRNNSSSLIMEDNKDYKTDDIPTLQYLNENGKYFAEFLVPFSRSYNTDFYLQKLAEDFGIQNVSQGELVWTFELVFHLKIIDENLGYSTSFNIQNLGEINILLTYEEFE